MSVSSAAIIAANGFRLRRIRVVLFDGQSNSVGGGSGTSPLICSTPLTSNGLMLNTGPALPRNNSSIYTFPGANSFVPSFEVIINNGALRETPNTRFMYEMQQQLIEMGEEPVLMMMLGIGVPSLTITQLNPPNNPFYSAVNGVQRIIDICRLNEMVPEFLPVQWAQGESQPGTPATTYRDEMFNRMQVVYDDAFLPIIRSLVPDHPPLHVMISQLPISGSGDPTQVPLGQLMCVQENERFHMGPPMSQLTKLNQDHPTIPMRQQWAGQMAKSNIEWLQSGGTSVRYLRIADVVTLDNRTFKARLTDHPGLLVELTDPPIQISGNAVVPSLTDLGLMFTDPISRVVSGTVVDAGTAIEFVADPAPALGSSLLTALTISGHKIGNAQTCITDSRPGVSTYDQNWPLHRWANSNSVPYTFDYDGDDIEAIPGLQDLFLPDYGRVESAGRVQRWDAKVGTSYFDFPTSAKRPIFQTGVINGADAIFFDATRDDFGNWLNGLMPQDDFAMVAWLVEGPNAVTGSTHIFSSTNSSVPGRHLFFYNTDEPIERGAAATVTGATDGESKSTPPPAGYVKGTSVLMCSMSFAATGDRRVWVSVNGGTWVASDGVIDSDVVPLTPSSIGTTFGSVVGNMDAKFAGFALFDRTLNTGEDAVAYRTLANYGVNELGMVMAP